MWCDASSKAEECVPLIVVMLMRNHNSAFPFTTRDCVPTIVS